MSLRLCCGAALVAVLLPTVASANERHFTYSYESGVLPEGTKEIEVWNTYRTGRPTYFRQVDHRVEFEVGLTSRLQTAFYLNFSGVAEADGKGAISDRFAYKGISSEWKYRLTDPVADALGIALYGELAFAPDVWDVEAKLILDKRIGRFLIASNLIVEPEFERGEDEAEIELAATLGATYFLLPHLAIGAEGRIETKVTDESASGVAAYAGPVVAWSSRDVWAALSFQRQLPALRREPAGGTFLADGHERYQVRLLFSFHI